MSRRLVCSVTVKGWTCAFRTIVLVYFENALSMGCKMHAHPLSSSWIAAICIFFGLREEEASRFPRHAAPVLIISADLASDKGFQIARFIRNKVFQIARPSMRIRRGS